MIDRFASVLLLLSAAFAYETPLAQYGHGAHGWKLPDPEETPGVIALHDTKQVCGRKWGLDVRHVTQAMKKHVCLKYGARECPGPKWEVDHLVSRELGGADHVKNLWPQPITEARKKDWLENAAHRAVCAGTLTLGHTQAAIRNDWTTLYDALKTP